MVFSEDYNNLQNKKKYMPILIISTSSAFVYKIVNREIVCEASQMFWTNMPKLF